jgi:hypothetical protein
MEVISVILMFVFGNMNDQATQMTQYVPMEIIIFLYERSTIT